MQISKKLHSKIHHYVMPRGGAQFTNSSASLSASVNECIQHTEQSLYYTLRTQIMKIMSETSIIKKFN